MILCAPVNKNTRQKRLQGLRKRNASNWNNSWEKIPVITRTTTALHVWTTHKTQTTSSQFHKSKQNHNHKTFTP